MSASTQKKIGIAVAVVAVLCLVGWLVVVPMLERKQAGKIEDLFALLPYEIKAERIETSLFSDTVTLTGLTAAGTGGTGIGDGTLDYRLYAAKIVVAGINYSAAKADAVTTLVDSIAFTDLTLEMNDAYSKQSMFIGEWKANDVALNLFSLLNHARTEEKPSPLKALGSLRMGAGAYVSYRHSMDIGFGPIIINVASGAYDEGTLWSARGMALNDMTVALAGKDIGRLDNVSVRLWSMPDIAEQVDRLNGKADFDSPEEAEAFLQDLRALLKAQPVRMEGCVFSGLTLYSMTDEPITMAGMSLDLTLSLDDLLMTHSIDNLVLPEKVLLEMFPAQAFFFADYAKPLQLSNRLTFSIGEKDGRTAISLGDVELGDPNLGKATLQLRLSAALKPGESPLLTLGDADAPALELLEASLADKGLLQAVSKAIAAVGQPAGTPDASAGKVFLQAQADQLVQAATDAGGSPESVAFARNLANFLRESGTIRVKVVPVGPAVSLDELTGEFLLPAGKVRLESEHLPR